MILQSGGQTRLVQEVTTGSGVTVKQGSVKTDSLMVSLWVSSVTSGTLDLVVTTLTEEGKESEIIVFPQVSSGTASLLLKKAAVTLQRFKVTATYTGVCEYEVYVRAIEGAGEASVVIVGPANLSTSSATVTTTPGVLLAPTLTDRQGVALKNMSSTATIYVSEDQAKLPGDAWPIGPGETWGLDVASGVTLYAVASAGSVNVRIAEVGG